MANNVNIATKSTGQQHTAAELNLQVGWMNEPSQSLGTFNPAMTFDGSGDYDDYTLSTNITLTATGIKKGNFRSVDITGNGSNTLAVGSGCALVSGNIGALSTGVHQFYMYAKTNSQVRISVINASQAQLSPPTNFSAVAGDGSVSLSWDSVAGATGYTLEFHSGDGIWASVPTYNGTSTSYDHTSLTNGTTYYYRLKATGSGYSDSAYVQTNQTPQSGTPTLTAPTLTLTVISDQRLTAQWTAETGAESIDYQLASDSGFTSIIDSGNILISTLVKNFYPPNVTASNTYYFRVRSVGTGYSSSSWASDNATMDDASIISANTPLAWWKSSKEILFTKDGSNNISDVAFIYPSQYGFTTDAGNLPLWASGGVVFDITNTEYFKSTNSTFASYLNAVNDPFTVLMVVKFNTIDSNYYNIFNAETSSGTSSRFNIYVNNTNVLGIQKITTTYAALVKLTSTTLIQGNTYIIAVSNDASQNLNVRINAVDEFNNESFNPGGAYANAPDLINIGRLENHAGSPGYSNIEIKEFAVLGVALTNAQLATAITELNARNTVF